MKFETRFEKVFYFTKHGTCVHNFHFHFIIHSGKEDMYRASAIRALCTITDATMLQAIERYMKQAIVDRFV